MPQHRILCFGASLVEGYVAGSAAFYPYSSTFSHLLRAAGYDVEVTNEGRSGDTTTVMVPRFEKIVSTGNYTMAIILGGTNDLMQKDPDMTAGNLIKMYKFARDRGITPVGVTLPGTAHDDRFDWLLQTRLGVNERIKTHCAENNIAVIDLAVLIPHNSLPREERVKIWSAYGYELFGEHVFNAVTKILPPPK